MKDITDEVTFGWNDDELLPLTKCACGKTWKWWEFTIGIEKDDPVECPECGRKLVWSTSIKVYEL